MSTVVTRRPIYGRNGAASKTGYWLDASIDGGVPIGFVRIYLAANTARSRVPHPELVALAAKIDAAVLPEPKSEKLLDDDQRERLVKACADKVVDALRKDRELALEAAMEGRIGLDEMSDADLIDYAWDCWGIKHGEITVGADPQPV
ncbi:hypothetical protein [Achromobacter sp. AGC39]